MLAGTRHRLGTGPRTTLLSPGDEDWRKLPEISPETTCTAATAATGYSSAQICRYVQTHNCLNIQHTSRCCCCCRPPALRLFPSRFQIFCDLLTLCPGPGTTQPWNVTREKCELVISSIKILFGTKAFYFQSS